MDREIRLEPGPQGHCDPVRQRRDRGRARGARAVAADAAADRFPGHLQLHHAVQLLSVRDHARHDHGHLPAHGAVPRRLRQLPDSPHVRRPRHGVPVHEHAELLGLPALRHHSARELLRHGRPHGRRLDALPAADRARRHAGPRLGHSADAAVARDLHRRVHDGRLELRDHGAAGALPRHDVDADAALGLGHLRCDDLGSPRISGAARRRDHDDPRPLDRHELLHARADVARRAQRDRRRQPGPVPASVLVLRPPRGLHRRAARVRHRVGSLEHARAQEHLRLPHDGVGHHRDRRAVASSFGRTTCTSAA